MKKIWIFGLYTAFAVLPALVFSGCPVKDEPKTREMVQITITDMSTPPLPSPGSSGSLFFSLSIFKEAGDIKASQTSLTKLEGQVCPDWLGIGKTPGPINIDITAIPNGDYVLVLGASPNMSGENGKMFITRGGSGTSAEAGKVSLNFSDGAASVSFDKDFIKNGESGWEVDEIIKLFGANP
ncbi:MAG: hypothetical protein LBU18_05150 [Treponema sp.]|jgi:hypothetical protein|nr:hypothetical protein [Treponema sp.]